MQLYCKACNCVDFALCEGNVSTSFHSLTGHFCVSIAVSFNVGVAILILLVLANVWQLSSNVLFAIKVVTIPLF